jgi:hypothetical protein
MDHMHDEKQAANPALKTDRGTQGDTNYAYDQFKRELCEMSKDEFSLFIKTATGVSDGPAVKYLHVFELSCGRPDSQVKNSVHPNNATDRPQPQPSLTGDKIK